MNILGLKIFFSSYVQHVMVIWCTNSFLMVFFQYKTSDTAKNANQLPTLRNYLNTSSIEFMVVLILLFPVKVWDTAKYQALKIQLRQLILPMIELHSYDMDLLFHKVSSKQVEFNVTTLQMMDSLKQLVNYFNYMKL